MPEFDIEAPIQERCRKLSEILELDEPVSETVLFAALDDETYAHNLLTCRRAPGLLRHLLANPPVAREQFSSVALAQRAAAAFARWAATGFSTVDDATYARRMSACATCPHFMAPPDGALYKLAARADRGHICGKCGCVVANKARLTSESCPDTHPDDAARTRWGEPRRDHQHSLA